MSDTFLLYKHTSPSGKVYIGITRQRAAKRWQRGEGYKHSPHMYAAIQKYGWDNFKHEILLTGLSQEEAAKKEIEYIALFSSADRRYGYNTDLGGYAPGKMSEETRRKMSESKMGDKNPMKRMQHPFLGKHHSLESRQKMSASAKARVGRVVTSETKMKLRNAQKKVRVIDSVDLKVYDGIHEAAEKTGCQPTKICSVCKGKRRSTGGRVWAYYEEWMG